METGNEIRMVIGNLGLAIGVFGALWMLFHFFLGMARRGKILATFAADPSRRVRRRIGLASSGVVWFVAAFSALVGDLRMALLALVMSVFGTLPAIGENQLCENGLWLQWMLIPWKKLKSYQWLEDHKLRLNISGQRRGVELLVGGDERDLVDRLLRENLCQDSSEAA
jgi:hypothetical protein